MANVVRPPALIAGIEARQAQVQRIQEMTGRHRKFVATVALKGPGEFQTPVVFPLMFTEEPAFSFGHVLGPNEMVLDGAFPLVATSVRRWDLFPAAGGLKNYYRGALVLVTVLSHPNLRDHTIHLHFEGMSLRNPTDPTTVDTATTDTVI